MNHIYFFIWPDWFPIKPRYTVHITSKSSKTSFENSVYPDQLASDKDS